MYSMVDAVCLDLASAFSFERKKKAHDMTGYKHKLCIKCSLMYTCEISHQLSSRTWKPIAQQKLLPDYVYPLRSSHTSI